MHDSGRANFLKRITSKSHFGESCTPLKSRVVSNHVWQAVRHEPTGQVFIHLHLIAKDRKGGFVYEERQMIDWQPLETAPKDGTLILLLVDGGENSTEDANIWRTIGVNNLHNDGEDCWRFAGWCWTHDHFTDGSGEVVGWSPIPAIEKVI